MWSTAIILRGVIVAARGDEKRFVQIFSSDATAVAAGTGYSMVLKQDGGLWAMGRNYRGQLGDGTRLRRDAFFLVQVIVGAKAVAAGGAHTLVLTQEGRVWITGWNEYGQLGDGTMHSRTRFSGMISKGAKPVAVAAGNVHSLVLKQDGTVWAAGRNYHGQLGDGSKTDRSSFCRVALSDAVDLSAGGYHSIVIKQDGSVWATGWNEYGQLGDGSTIDRSNYVQVVLREANAVAAGMRHTMMLKQDGSVWSTGYNDYGQLGAGWDSISSMVFVNVISDGVRAVAAGDFHSMVLKEDGSIWATGSNEDGQFGDGWTTSHKTFVRLAPFGNVHGTITYAWMHLHIAAIA